MTTNLLTWCLAGALAASLAWNVHDMRRADEVPAACAPTACSAASREAVFSQLDLTPEQRQELAQWNTQACGPSVDLDALAIERSDQLFDLLSRPDLDPEKVHALATEVSELRARSLRSCVDSILEVRRHLKPEQVEALLEHGCRAAAH